ncbi:lysostaphin resistance A-like protein [Phosphitispora sp. TUW77]|uniref:CPBP family intramembrane glutamic endopeptidase n=1 Tax=Phosphitispora sp. TUW77 TaxID=3152361 RepID=UPI003AB8E5A5
MESKKVVLPPLYPKWKWWDLVLVLVMLLALIPASGLLKNYILQMISALKITGNSPQTLALFLGTFVQAGIMIFSVALLTWRRHGSREDLGLISDNLMQNIFLGLGGGIVLAVVVWIMGLIVFRIFGPPPPQDIEKLLTGLKSGRDLLLPFISVSVLAPLSEEIYFRGMVFPVIRARYGQAAGMLLSGLIFGALHMDIYRVLPITAMGFMLAYFYETTGSLITPIVAHCAWNSIMLFIFYIAGNY